MALLSALETEIAILVCAVVGIAYSYHLVRWFPKSRNSNRLDHEDQRLTAYSYLVRRFPMLTSRNSNSLGHEHQRLSVMAKWDEMTREGVEAFLFTEYWYGGVFMVAFAIIIFLCLGSVESFSTQSRPCRFDPSNMCKPALATAIFSAVSFLLGAFTSVLPGFLGMQIAIYANLRTALEEGKGVGEGFFSAFRSGAVMGFLLAADGLLVLYIAINLFKLYYGNDWEGLFEAIAGYGLGGSSMALFERGSGRIYATAADVCAHPIIRSGLRTYRGYTNMLDVIYHCVGDIVGDIAGVGTDYFVSYAGSSCAALVVASVSSFGNDHDFTAMCYPLLISSVGILACLTTNLCMTGLSKIGKWKKINLALWTQLVFSTILMTVGIAIVSWIALPSSFPVYDFGSQKVAKNWQLGFCVGVGLWARLIGRLVPKYSTKEAPSSVVGAAADNVNAGLASAPIPFLAAICIFVGSSFAGTYGIALSALGMGITTDSAALVCISLFGALVSRVAISPTDVPTPKFFMGLIVGGMLSYTFSTMTMKSVGTAASKMAGNGLASIDVESLDDAKCIKITTDAAIWGMIRPFALVMLTPLIVGTFFGLEMLSGVLAGSLTYVVKIAISASNTGKAFDKAQELIEAGALINQPREYVETFLNEDRKMTLEHVIKPGAMTKVMSLLERELAEFAKSEEFIGDPPKDTLGPVLNILIQLMTVESLVFAPFLATHGGLFFKIF